MSKKKKPSLPKENSQPKITYGKQSIKVVRGTVRNVVQAVINIGARGLLVVAIAIVVYAIIFNIEPLRKLIPGQPPFLPARSDESLIIVASFDDRSQGKYQGIDPAQYIFESIKHQIEKDNRNIRVERLQESVDNNTVKSIGAKYKATLVVWGWYDALTINPRLERIKFKGELMSSLEERRVSLSDPDNIEFIITKNLPAYTTYITFYAIAMNQYTQGNYKQSIDYGENAVDSITDEMTTSINPFEAYKLMGASALSDNDVEEGISFLQLATQYNPNDGEILNNLGVAYHQKGMYDKAVEMYKEAVLLEIEDPSIVYKNLGQVYEMTEDTVSAIRSYEEAIKLDPNYAEPHFNLSILYLNQNNEDKANEEIKLGLKIWATDMSKLLKAIEIYGEDVPISEIEGIHIKNLLYDIQIVPMGPVTDGSDERITQYLEEQGFTIKK